MRERRTVRHPTAAALVVALIVAGASIAPATFARESGTASATRPAAESGRCAPGTVRAVTDAYETLFGRNQPATPDDRAARLAGAGDPALRALLDDWLADPAGATSSITVNEVRCPGRSRAVVDADLNLAGTPLPEVLPPGRAVREDGTWKVARSTFCVRMVLEDPALATSGVCARRSR